MNCACDEATGLCGYHAEIVRKEVKYALNNAGLQGTARSTRGESGNEADLAVPAPNISALMGRLEAASRDERLATGALYREVGQVLHALEVERNKFRAMAQANENMRQFEADLREGARNRAESLQHQLTLTREWLRRCDEVLSEISIPSFDDSRISYVEVQMNREAYNKVNGLIAEIRKAMEK